MAWKNTTAGKEFDLDDPHFTTPMSVISGLASGLCERKAAVDATFNTQSWGANQTGQQKLNTQSATVSNMAANIAITHSTTETSAYAANAEKFAAPTSWTQDGQTKTYLDYFDNALVNVANLYVNRGGVAYNGFDGLAAAASARADSDVNVSHYAGYTVGTTATSGGSGVVGDAGRPAYVGTFTPMFRADWAVERRDMLEELRYVKEAETMGMLEADDNDPFLSLIASGSATNNDTYVEDGYVYPVRDYGGDVDFAYGSADIAENYTSIGSATYGIDCDVYDTTAATTNVAYYVQVDAGDAWSRSFMDYMNMDYVEDGAIVYAAANHEYCVKSGGTLFTRFDDETGNVAVESGGSMVCLGPPSNIPVRQNEMTYGEGAEVLFPGSPLMVYLIAANAGVTGAAPPEVTDWEEPIQDGSITWNIVWFNPGADEINLFSGAVITPYTSGNQFTAFANKITYAFRTVGPEWRDAAEGYGDTFKQGYYYAGGQVTVASDTKAMVVAGASAAIASGASCVYISGATASLGPGAACSRVVVDNGGKFVVDGGTLDEVAVLPGGSLTLSGNENNSGWIDGDLLISSGASVLINSPHTSIGHLRLFDDAILDVANGAYTGEDVYHNIYYSTILHFCTFGIFGDTMADDVHSGWRTVTATKNTAESDSEYHIAGTSDPAVGSTTVANYIAGNLDTLSARISGSFYVGGVEYLPEEALRQFEPDDVNIYYGASIRGLNSRGGAYTIDDKYPQFAYRKFGDDHK